MSPEFGLLNVVNVASVAKIATFSLHCMAGTERETAEMTF